MCWTCQLVKEVASLGKGLEAIDYFQEIWLKQDWKKWWKNICQGNEGHIGISYNIRQNRPKNKV